MEQDSSHCPTCVSTEKSSLMSMASPMDMTIPPPPPKSSQEEQAGDMIKKVCMDTREMHFTKEAQDYQMQECVSRTMKKMSKSSSCIKYMSGILALGSDNSSCSINQLKGFCEKSKDEFTMNDAKNWCMKKNEATASFWKHKFQK